MKKTIFLFLIFNLIVLIPIFSQADIGAPAIPEYDAIVIKADGTELLNNNYESMGIIVPFNSNIVVKYEYYFDNKNYANIEYNGENGYVKIEDISASVDGIDFSEFENVESQNLEMYAYKEGAYLYKGPSVTYGRVDNNEMVKVGDTVKILYDAGGECWGYVNYNGTKGWVYYYQLMDNGLYYEVSSLCKKMLKKSSVITIQDGLRLVSSPDNRENYLDVQIPKGTKLEYRYVFELHEQPYVYVTYNGVNGWLDSNYENAVLEISNIYIYVNDKNNVKVYEKPFEGEKEVNNLENGKVYRATHYSTDHIGAEVKYVIEVDGENYWLKENFEENDNLGFFELYETVYPEYNIVKNECKVFASLDENSEVVATLEPNQIFNNTYIGCGNSNVNLVEEFTYVANLGFVKKENIERCYEEIDPDNPNIIDFSKTEEEQDEEVDTIEKTDFSENKIKEKKPLDFSTIIIICIVGAIIIAITAMVSIKLINKKKDKEN